MTEGHRGEVEMGMKQGRETERERERERERGGEERWVTESGVKERERR